VAILVWRNDRKEKEEAMLRVKLDSKITRNLNLKFSVCKNSVGECEESLFGLSVKKNVRWGAVSRTGEALQNRG
jgi:hypothetical protein